MCDRHFISNLGCRSCAAELGVTLPPPARLAFRWEYALRLAEGMLENTGAIWEPVDARCQDCGNYLLKLFTHASPTIATVACVDCMKNNELVHAARSLKELLKMVLNGYMPGRDHTHPSKNAPF